MGRNRRKIRRIEDRLIEREEDRFQEAVDRAEACLFERLIRSGIVRCGEESEKILV